MIRVGPAGWDYPDWRGTVYPEPRPKGFDPLAYLSRYFRTIEINSSFYRPPVAKTAEGWLARVEPQKDFRFTAKLWRRFTHERATPWTAAEMKEARVGMDRLFEAGRLGALLLQFPWSFRKEEGNEEWLSDLFRALRPLPLVLEVRHASWAEPSVLDWLRDASVGLVNVDQPGFGQSLRASSHVTAPVGYVRLHGRNYRDWFRKSAGRDQRYDYLYSAKELAPWAERIRAIAARSAETYAVTNNHPNGQAPANAEMLEAMLTGEKVPAPPALVQRFSRELEPFVVPA
jgi:uncharacterized protein YecE (DUF72 family)